MASPLREDSERLVTAEEFARMPEQDAFEFELVRGRVIRSPKPATSHGLLVARCTWALAEFVETGGHGVVVTEGGTLLARGPDTVRGPDVAYYSRARIPRSAYETTFWGPPDLAVEILSPSNTAAELDDKLADYLGAGVREVWVIDPAERSATVHRADRTPCTVTSPAVLEGDDVLPGFRLPLAGFFAL